MPDNKEDTVTLAILQTVAEQSDVTQRRLAQRLGIALGLANSYLKRCIRKGLVKVKQAPANRYLYYLTPQGFAEKSRLTAQYLYYSFDFYRRASASCAQALQECKNKGWSQVLFCGVSELTEIASLRAGEHGIEVVGTYDREASRDTFIHKPLWRHLEGSANFDAVLLTALQRPELYYQELIARMSPERVIVPHILDFVRAP